MAFKFKCKYCDQHIEAEDFMVGNEFCCPSCNQPLTVPAIDRVTELDEIQPVIPPVSAGYFSSTPPPPPPEMPRITKIHEEPSLWSKIIAVLTCVNTVLLLAVIIILIAFACCSAESECTSAAEECRKVNAAAETTADDPAEDAPPVREAVPAETSAGRRSRSTRR